MGDPAAVFDAAYLEGYTGGDRGVIGEVLALFRQQAEGWREQLAEPTEGGWRDLAHMIKGSAKGIGANALGDIAAAAEFADPTHAAAVAAALDVTLAAIEAYEASA